MDKKRHDGDGEKPNHRLASCEKIRKWIMYVLYPLPVVNIIYWIWFNNYIQLMVETKIASHYVECQYVFRKFPSGFLTSFFISYMFVYCPSFLVALPPLIVRFDLMPFNVREPRTQGYLISCEIFTAQYNCRYIHALSRTKFRFRFATWRIFVE